MIETPAPRTKGALLGATFALTAFATVVFAGSAAAHNCDAPDPAAACGGCPSGDHLHRYSQGSPGHAAGSTYCSSSSPPPPSDCTILGISVPEIICEGPLFNQIGYVH